jgi:hypothetical protein
MYKMILIIFFSLLLFTSCKTTDVVGRSWIIPEKPELVQPQFINNGGNLCLDRENSIILRNNLLEMKAYEKKLEFLVDQMLRHYTQ